MILGRGALSLQQSKFENLVSISIRLKDLRAWKHLILCTGRKRRVEKDIYFSEALYKKGSLSDT
jgi:hypothetical protein